MSLACLANPLQGTASDIEFSRGNTLPIAAQPFGLHHWSLQTRDDPWFFHPGDRKLWGMRLTHQASPWMQDYSTLLVTAFLGQTLERIEHQASAYRLLECFPHAMKLELCRHGIICQMVPTARGAVFTFTSHSSVSSIAEAPLKVRLYFRGKHPHSIEAGAGGGTGGSAQASRWFTGFTHDNSGGIPSADFGLSFYGDFSEQPASYTALPNGGVWEFPRGVRHVELRLAGSFISREVARHSHSLELERYTFAELRSASQRTWDDLLGRFGHPESAQKSDKARTFYSCVYRTLLFPRQLEEIDPGTGNGVHYSPYDGGVHAGPLCTDNGFWDTHRTVYPFLAQAYPDKLTPLLEGWLNACREADWAPKWPSPGPKACMIGTHFDAVVADAIARGVTDWDIEAVFPYLWKNATVPSADGCFGREGLEDYLRLGYVPVDRHRYSVSATLDYAYEDFCVMQVARHLGCTKEAAILEPRTRNYRNVFDSTTGFMRERLADGSWHSPWEEFRWGGGYIEGGPWQHTFNVPHDVPGLAALYGGKAQLCEKLDRMLATPPHLDVGHYGFEIHEMTEMAVAGFGQYAHSNQPVHSNLFLYAACGQPEKTSHWVRRVCEELYTPDSLPGDEDNGEMCAWYVMAHLGRFPYCPGSADYTVFEPPVPGVRLLTNGTR